MCVGERECVGVCVGVCAFLCSAVLSFMQIRRVYSMPEKSVSERNQLGLKEALEL